MTLVLLALICENETKFVALMVEYDDDFDDDNYDDDDDDERRYVTRTKS